MKRKVLILGGGVAALAAGIALLDDGGAARFDVTLACMEGRLGGKAASWRRPDGRYMETGFHSLFGYYTAMPRLLERAGRSVRDPRWFTSNGGAHRMYEPGARALNLLRVPKHFLDVDSVIASDALHYRGMTASQRARSALWLARLAARLHFTNPAPDLDEYGFTAWCVAHGLDLDLTATAWFRYVFDLTYNYPHEGSAYVGVQGFKDLLGYRNAEVLYLNGPMNDVLIAPLAEHFAKLGGRVLFCEKAVRMAFAKDGRVSELVTAPMAAYDRVDGVHDRVTVRAGEGAALADAPYPTGEPLPPAGAAERTWRAGEDFDVVVSTLPVDSLRALLTATEASKSVAMRNATLAALWKVRSVVSISLRMWLPERVVPGDIDTVVLGLPQPTATGIDYANRVDELRKGGSVVELLGQEGLDGGLDDGELARRIVENFAGLSFVDERFNAEDVLARRNGCEYEFRRNAASHMRYALLEPGHWRHIPGNTVEGVGNLVMAGDWVRSTQPTVSTEAAARSGEDAARVVRGLAG